MKMSKAVLFMIDTKLFALSPRHVTVSTVGVLKNMKRLSDELPYVNLAFSLHAPNQEVRLKIVPAARAHPLEALMAAVDYHIEKNNAQFAHLARKQKFSKSSGYNSGVATPKSTHSDNPVDPMSTMAAVEKLATLRETEAEEEGVEEQKGNADSELGQVDLTKVNEEEELEESLESRTGLHLNHGSSSVPTAAANTSSDNNSTSLCEATNLCGQRPSKITGVMIEYILIKDINDSAENAHELAALLSQNNRRPHILLNLIPYNPTEVAEDYEAPLDETVDGFHRICISHPYEIHTRVRQEKGQDIAGACGQLALVRAKETGSGVNGQGGGEEGQEVDMEDTDQLLNAHNGQRSSTKSNKATKLSKLGQKQQQQKLSSPDAHSSAFGINISDNSPIVENENDTIQRSQRCRQWTYLSLGILPAIVAVQGVLALVAAKQQQ